MTDRDHLRRVALTAALLGVTGAVLAGCSGTTPALPSGPGASTPAAEPSSSLPADQPRLDELADALDAEGSGAYQSVFSEVIVDDAADQVTLRATSIAAAVRLEESARRRHPALEWNRVELATARYPQVLLDQRMSRLMSSAAATRYHLVTLAPDAAYGGLDATVDKRAALPPLASVADDLTRSAGVPVHVFAGDAPVAAGGS